MSPELRLAPDFSVVVPIARGRQPLVLESFRCLVPGSYELFVDEGPNPSTNRNRSIQRARARILAFTDDDCVVTPQWLASAAAFFHAHPDCDVVGGPQLNMDNEGRIARAIGYALGSRFGTYRTNGRFTRRRLRLDATQFDLTSANLFMTRRAFEKWGPFDERLWPNEETHLLHQIEKAGGRIAYDPSIVVLHKRRNSLWQLARQCFGYGCGRARQTRIERALPGVAQMLPVAFLVYLALLPLLALQGPVALLPLAVYAMTSVAVSAATALAQRDGYTTLVMPFVFLTIHTTYPAGLFYETMRMMIQRHDLSHPDREPTSREPEPDDDRAVAARHVTQPAPGVRTVEIRQ